MKISDLVHFICKNAQSMSDVHIKSYFLMKPEWCHRNGGAGGRLMGQSSPEMAVQPFPRLQKLNQRHMRQSPTSNWTRTRNVTEISSCLQMGLNCSPYIVLHHLTLSSTLKWSSPLPASEEILIHFFPICTTHAVLEGISAWFYHFCLPLCFVKTSPVL